MSTYGYFGCVTTDEYGGLVINSVDIVDIGIHSVVFLVVLYTPDKLHSRHDVQRMLNNPGIRGMKNRVQMIFDKANQFPFYCYLTFRIRKCTEKKSI